MPKLIIILSGKRKSGKSFLTEALTDYFGGDNCCVLTLAAPLKKQYAETHGLDYNRLLDTSGSEVQKKDFTLNGMNSKFSVFYFFTNSKH